MKKDGFLYGIFYTIGTFAIAAFFVANPMWLTSCSDGSEEQPEKKEIVEVPTDTAATYQDVKNQEPEQPVVEEKSKKHTSKGNLETDESGKTKYIVHEGETLETIAADYYGDSRYWFKIFAANESEIDDWNNIRPGQVLTLPEIN